MATTHPEDADVEKLLGLVDRDGLGLGDEAAEHFERKAPEAMMMPSARRAIAAAALIASLAASPALPDDGGSTPERTADPAPTEIAQTTDVRGPVPNGLDGRWLVVEHIFLQGMVRPFARLWEIHRGPQHLEVVLRAVELPDTVYASLEVAGTANRSWTPDDRDLREIAERWDELPASATGLTQVEHQVLVADAYSPELRDSQVTKGTSLAIVSRERFSVERPITSTRSVYGVRELSAERLSGMFMSESTAADPAPVAITLRGRFQAYRVAVPPPRRRVRRLLDILMGRV